MSSKDRPLIRPSATFSPYEGEKGHGRALLCPSSRIFPLIVADVGFVATLESHV